jgi:hypothetical protein
MNVPGSRSQKRKGERGRGRSLANRCRWRNSRKESVVKRTWKSDLKGSNEVRLGFCRITQLTDVLVERKGALENAEADAADGDAFDIAVEDAIADRPAKHAKGPGGKKMARNARDQKFGFGGQGRRSKQNTKASTDNFDSAPGKRAGHGPKAGRGGAGGSKRPGKSKRVAFRSRK